MSREVPKCWQFFVGAALAREVPEAQEEIERAVQKMAPLAPPLPDPQTPRDRTRANLRAMAIVNRVETGTVFDLLAYSGWGGLAEAWEALPGPVRASISSEELIAAFYTPHFLAFEMARLAMRYAPKASLVLDPAAGSGRLLFPLAAVGYRCVGIELQKTTAAVLRRWGDTLNVRVIEGAFERHYLDVGRPDVVISNPPYGERALRAYDREFSKTTRAHVYFLLRATTLLADGGVGIFLMPDGFLTGDSFAEVRRAWLALAQLKEAWQLPGDIFPGAKVNTSILVFVRRASAWTAEDEEIARGRYFSLYPERIQGEASGRGKGRWSLVRQGPSACLIGPLPPAEIPRRGPSQAEAPRVELVERAAWLLRRIDKGSLPWQLDVQSYRRAGGSDPRLAPETPRIPAHLRARREWAMVQLPVPGPWEARDEAELKAAGWREWPGRGWVPTPLYGSLSEISKLPAPPASVGAELRALLDEVGSSVADAVPWTARWLPLGVLQAWLKGRSEGALVLRESTVVVVRGTSDAPAIMAQINGDDSFWASAETVTRQAWLKSLDLSWAEFLRTEPWRSEVRIAHARTFRLSVAPPRDSTPEILPRWDLSFRTPHHYQWAEARKVVRTQRNLTGFDVGLGKTLTAILAWALLREAGQAQRTLAIVPSSTVPGWVETWRRAIPDVRILVVGADLDSYPPKSDSSAKRAAKFRAFAEGAAEVCVCTRDAFKSIRVDRVAAVDAVLAEDGLRRVAFGEKGGITARELARKEASAKAFVDELLGIVEDEDSSFPQASELGADHVIVDEAQAYANLIPPPTWGGNVESIAFVGSSGQVSQRSWHLTLALRPLARSGTTTHFLTATPASNGMLDLYNVSQPLGNPWPEATAREWLEAYARLGNVLKERSTGAVEEVTAVVGFQREAEFFRILECFATFATARSVGLPLPDAIAERVMVPAGEEASGIIAMLTRMAKAAKKRKFAIVRRYFTLLNMAAVHPALVDPRELVEGEDEVDFGDEQDEDEDDEPRYKPPTAAPPSAKFRAVLEHLDDTCGHIIFLDYTAAQAWLAEAIRKTGRTVEVLSGEVAVSERGKIRDRFNSGATDVVIVGGVGQEGVDLQARTCAVHHVDLPWTPARLEQRNGRAVRQGAGSKVVRIFYYLLTPSGDSLRLGVVLGKGSALDQLIERRSTNNPASDTDSVGIVDLLREASGHSDRFDKWISALEEGRDELEERKQEERRVGAILNARARYVGGLDKELSDSLTLLFPTWERASLSQPEVIRLREPADNRTWWTAPDQWIERHGDALQVTLVQTPDGPRVVLRSASSVLHEVHTLGAFENYRATPVTPPVEDLEAIRAAITVDVPWSFFPPAFVDAVWAGGPPEHLAESRGFPRQREGRLVAGLEGVLVPPTLEGFKTANNLPYNMSRAWLTRWRTYWRETLPQRPTVEEQTIFLARSEDAVDEAALGAVFRVPRGMEGASVGDLRTHLSAPVGGGRRLAEGERLVGPGFSDRTPPETTFAPDLLFSEHIARAEITRSTRVLAPGIVADAVMLGDGSWRPGIRDLGTRHQWLWFGLDAFEEAEPALAWAFEVWRRESLKLVTGETVTVSFERRQALAALAADLQTEAVVLGIEKDRTWLGKFVAPLLVAVEMGGGSGRDEPIVHGLAAAQFAEILDKMPRGEPVRATVATPGAIMGAGVVVQTSHVRDLHLGRVELGRLVWTGERSRALASVTQDEVIVSPQGLVAKRGALYFVSRSGEEWNHLPTVKFTGEFFTQLWELGNGANLLLLENGSLMDIASRAPVVICLGSAVATPWEIPKAPPKSWTVPVSVADLLTRIKGADNAYLVSKTEPRAAGRTLWIRVSEKHWPVVAPEVDDNKRKKQKEAPRAPVSSPFEGVLRVPSAPLRDALRYAQRVFGGLKVALSTDQNGTLLVGTESDFYALLGEWVAEGEPE